jgi:ribosome-associated protein
MNDNIPEDDDDWISKTQRKHECDNMQKLGEQLITLKISELNEFNLPDNLRNALEDAHKISQRGALKRHKQYIGKVMRSVDVDDIQKQYDNFCHKDDVNNAHFKRLEKWRDRILAEGDKALGELIGEFPQIDRQQLRQLIRKAHKEKELNKPPAAYRQIFKYLREISES